MKMGYKQRELLLVTQIWEECSKIFCISRHQLVHCELQFLETDLQRVRTYISFQGANFTHSAKFW